MVSSCGELRAAQKLKLFFVLVSNEEEHIVLIHSPVANMSTE